MRSRDERGVATVLAVSMMGLLLSVTLAVGGGISVVAAHRVAQSAADLASLAGAAALQAGRDPCAAAGVIARRNRAGLDQCVVRDWDVAVTVGVRARLLGTSVALRARARAGPAAR